MYRLINEEAQRFRFRQTEDAFDGKKVVQFGLFVGGQRARLFESEQLAQSRLLPSGRLESQHFFRREAGHETSEIIEHRKIGGGGEHD